MVVDLFFSLIPLLANACVHDDDTWEMVRALVETWLWWYVAMASWRQAILGSFPLYSMVQYFADRKSVV